MKFSVANHKLYKDGQQVRWNKTPNQSKVITPTVVVLHDTAGPSLKSAENWFEQSKANASAHIVLGRDGEIVQMGDFNRKLYHAGRSKWNGRPYVNDFAIGIEIVNPGQLKKGSDGKYRPWYNMTYEDTNTPGQGDIREGSQKYAGISWSGYWMDYTPEQIESVVGILIALKDKYPIKDIVTHWMISPGRKVDPNPLFPLDMVKDRVAGNNADHDDHQETSPASPGHTSRTKTLLNLRQWPSFNESNIIMVLPQDALVTEIRYGSFPINVDNVFKEGTLDWTYVDFSGQKGWVVSSYLEKV